VDWLRPAAIGMDIDRGAIKAVQVSRSGGEHVLQHVGYRRLPPGVISDGEVADHDLLASELREFWSSHAFRGKSVWLGLSNQKVVVRLLDMPRMSEEDLRGAISFQAQDHIPMPLEEVVMDHMVLGPESEGSDLDRVLIVAAQRDMVSRYTSAVRTAGLRPAGVDVKALSLLRSTLPETLFEDEGAVLLLDIGSEISNLAVSQGGTPAFVRFVQIGSDDFARSVAEAADIPEEEAQNQLTNPRARIGYGYGEEPQEEEPEEQEEGPEGAVDPALLYDVRRGLEEAVRVLAEEVQRSIEYHQFQPGAREVAQVVVSGEGALVSGIEGYLGELLGVPAHRGGPLGKISANRSNVSDDQLGLMEPILSVALGLALEGA
jgi:type IV pilus assembly protein PilM